MNDIQRPDIGQALTRYFGIREANPAPTLSPEVQPVVLVADLTLPTEPNTVRQCSGGYFASGVAGTSPHVQLFNPVGSGVLIKVTQLWVQPYGIDGVVHLSVDDTARGSDHATVKNFTNGVLGLASRPVGQIRSHDSLGSLGNLGWIAWLPGTGNPVELALPHVLVSGQGLNMFLAVPNQTLYGSFAWLEIPTEPIK